MRDVGGCAWVMEEDVVAAASIDGHGACGRLFLVGGFETGR